MQIINEARKDINKIWGQPSVKDTHYRPLKYLLEVPVDEGLLVHNVVSGELVLLEGDEIEQFHAPGPKPATAGSLSADCPDETTVFSSLVAKHFLVPLDFDEHASVLNLRKILRLLDTDKSITGYTILPTTYCNARCFYCYEADFEHIHMSDETADQVVDFIAKNHGGKPITIGWYGGEPLVGSKTISNICQKLEERNIEFTSSMISNGYLFDEELIETAKKLWRLNSVQITLDGTEDVYNKVKSYVGVQCSPYQRVIQNIELLMKEGIRITVRMNLDYHNYDNLDELIEELSRLFSKNYLFNSYVKKIFEDEGFEKVTHTDSERKDLEKKETELNDKLIRKCIQNLFISLPKFRTFSCMADADPSAIIYSDGTISKCMNYPSEHIGTIKDGITNHDRCNDWQVTVEFDECESCRFYPDCLKLKGCRSTEACTEEYREHRSALVKACLKQIYKTRENRENYSEISNEEIVC